MRARVCVRTRLCVCARARACVCPLRWGGVCVRVRARVGGGLGRQTQGGFKSQLSSIHSQLKSIDSRLLSVRTRLAARRQEVSVDEDTLRHRTRQLSKSTLLAASEADDAKLEKVCV